MSAPEPRPQTAAAAPAQREGAATATATAQPPRRYDSTTLFGNAVEIEIEHQQQVYRLRRTSLGKLILTK